MEAVIENTQVKVDKTKKEQRTFHVAFIIFLIGQIFLIVSTLSYAANINGVPRIFAMFDIFIVVTNVLHWIALFILKKVNNSFKLSFYSVSIFLVLLMVHTIAMSSSESLYVAIGRGLYWSRDIVQCIFYLYFFHGCILFFEKHNLTGGKKVAIVSLFVLLALFIASSVLTYLITVRSIQRNFVLYRVMLYSGWGTKFLIYAYTFVVVIVLGQYLKKMLGPLKKKRNKDEKRKAESVSN